MDRILTRIGTPPIPTRRQLLRTGASAAAIGTELLGAGPARAEASELRIAKQPGLSYLPAAVAEHLGLVEKHATAAGLSDVKVSWTRLTSGGASNDALLSGSVDMVISGGPNMLILWGKTSGRVKGVVCTGALPMKLVSNNPNVHSLADFTATDRIATPTIRVGTQPTVLGIAVEKAFGLNALERFNAMTIAMGHPDAMIALQNKGTNVTAHFSLPPFQEQELALPGVHTVLDSVNVMGGPITNGCVYSTTTFHDANPKLTAAFVAAIREAIALIGQDKRRAAEIYLAVNKEKISVDELTDLIGRPEMVFTAAPANLLPAAQFFSRAGYIKQKPNDWREFFFPEVHDLGGS
ncbi:ABC transporter substrate-binding protein [Methylobacterium brachythecii]|uniref:ABC transporter substrate-binding protein n=1 Tax=Methylobacterium brachythecii TaxID=1176177 RepID=A0A7W6AP19_9HYPH|nr:ABC transporter substrate-binding protein [Methylobacterium brachythecii]MBB3904829.1 NitT/TauT family transport system substrate-binding protein [Methylobacterium brachythecii]GLS45381.1 ABC transporter substrate-binding protein [Methylobacterium brachythecii]